MRDHVGNLSEPELLKLGIWNRLGVFGIDPPSRKRSRSKRISSTPCPSEKKRKASLLFGRPLRDLPKIRVDLSPCEEGISVSVPEFLPSIINLIRLDLEKEGLFRLSGSESRQRALRERLEVKEDLSTWCAEGNLSVIDAAALLKHWLRELPDPIVPDVYQDVMLRCCSLPSEVDYALTLATCLLPEDSSSTISYLFRFFLDVTLKSEFNKMDVRNLAIVLAPSIFPLVSKKGGSLESTKNILNLKTQIVEKLIINAKKICMVDGPLAEDYSCAILKIAPNFTSHSEDNLDNENMDGNTAAGPSERRSRKKKKKHRRSGSLSRVITAFKGIISRSTTPANRDSAHPDSLQTPDSFFSSPSLCKTKRKAVIAKETEEVKNSVEEFDKNYFHCSPKISKMETPVTPKVRGKSFSVKRFKKKKSLCKTKSSDSTTLVNYSPLRSRVSLVSRTPQTPDVVATINADRNLSDDESISDAQVLFTPKPTRDNKDYWCSSSLGNEEQTMNYSPSLRETAINTQTLISIPTPNLDSSTRSLTNSLRRGQPNSLNTGLAKPSPTETSGLHKSRIMINHQDEPTTSQGQDPRPKLRKDDSLAYLKKDLSILIESSFASEGGSLSSLDEDSTRNVEEIINKMKTIEMNNGMSPVTRSQLRRQSSAFEFARPESVSTNSRVVGASNVGGGAITRRQSSAFENDKQTLKRGETFRASLARKNSSVKDLVRRIESIKVPSFVIIPEGSSVPFSSEDPTEESEEQWMDAAEFFKTASFSNSTEEQQDQFEGCRRSSIIRIRNENRGKVSKSVETFTQPTPNRGVSARMGVATTPSPFVTKRRQQTGIRTTTGAVKRHIPKTTVDNNTSRTSGSTKPNASKKNEPVPPPRLRNKNRNKKSRRHLTIGYLGEPVGTRSPLKERANVITVQRSKSAQNPVRMEPSKKKKRRQSSSQHLSSENSAPVQRSHSCKNSEISGVPVTLKDTLYDHKSPKSEKVRRNLSDRVMTPTKGGLKNEAIPYMKSVRSKATPKIPSANTLGATPPNKVLAQNHKLSLNTPVRKSPRLAKIY